jgi:hypothetical protein
VLRSKVKDHDPQTISYFQHWLHRHMCLFGRDDQHQPTPHAHPPDKEIVAQFLAVAEPRHLAAMLENLMQERQEIYNYGWFVTVALQRCAGVTYTETKKARAALRAVRAGKPAPAEQLAFAQDLVRQAVAGVKKLR